MCIDGHSSFSIVDQTEPAAINPVNVTEENGRYYARRYDEEAGAYVTDYDKELEKWQLPCYANGSGADHMARVHNIEISNVKITNADPRYPILLMGLADSRIEDVIMKNITVEFRGGITMQQAVEPVSYTHLQSLQSEENMAEHGCAAKLTKKGEYAHGRFFWRCLKNKLYTGIILWS